MTEKSGQDLTIEISELRKKLNDAQASFKKRGVEWAKAEYDHDIAFAKAMLIEKENGTPATIIEKIVKGREEVAELKLKMNTAEVLYKSADKAIDNYKKQLGILNDERNLEWGKS